MMASDGLKAAVEGVEVVLAVGWLGYLEVKGLKVAYDKKKLASEIDGVQKAFIKTIANVPNTELPALFDKDFKTNILTSETLLTLINATPSYANKYLDRYVRQVMDALAFLYNYHTARIERGSKVDDITSSVLSYAILVLGEKCINIVNYDLAIVQLSCIANFLNEFASIRGQHSFRFVKLTGVVSRLEKAISVLKDHNLSLSFMERVKIILDQTSKVGSGMIRACAKLITPTANIKYLQAFIPRLLAAKILRQSAEYRQGLIYHCLAAIELPQSKLSDYIAMAAQDYLSALDLAENDNNNFINPQKFTIADINEEEIARAFRGCDNFLTLKSELRDDSAAVNKLIQVTPAELRPRVIFFIECMKIIHCINVSRYFARRLRDRLEAMGERYFNCPEETIYMFSVVDAFRDYMQNFADNLSTAMANIKAQQVNSMMVAGIGNDLYKEINAHLGLIKTEVCPSLEQLVNTHKDRLSNIHTGHHRHDKKPVIIRSNDPMLVIPQKIAEKFNLVIAQPIVQGQEQITIPSSSVEEKLFKRLGKIRLRIKELIDTEQDQRADRYNNVYLKLLMLFNHSSEMNAENDAQRTEKSKQLQLFLAAQCVLFRDFLKKSPLERELETNVLINSFEKNVKDPDAKFLDEHSRNSYLVIRFFKSYLINTRSRNEVNALVSASKSLQLMR